LRRTAVPRNGLFKKVSGKLLGSLDRCLADKFGALLILFPVHGCISTWRAAKVAALAKWATSPTLATNTATRSGLTKARLGPLGRHVALIAAMSRSGEATPLSWSSTSLSTSGSPAGGSLGHAVPASIAEPATSKQVGHANRYPFLAEHNVDLGLRPEAEPIQVLPVTGQIAKFRHLGRDRHEPGNHPCGTCRPRLGHGPPIALHPPVDKPRHPERCEQLTQSKLST
jgi:hypothetical protein